MALNAPKVRKFGRIKEKNKAEPGHLKRVAELPCCCCGGRPAIGHHLLRCPTRRGQYRAADREVIPLCSTHHTELHDRAGDEVAFLAKHGVPDGPALAASIYERLSA